MCGIAGIARRVPSGVEPATLARMAGAIRHRGPDGYGFVADRRVGLAHVRLSILDLERGDQPLANEDDRLWITYNGEIYNWRELRGDLAASGHRFRTNTDTEVIVHAWEQWGPAMLERFNGQFAFALYDRVDATVFLARDRFGVRPLYYAERGGDLFFASEAKALFASGEVVAAPDPAGLDEVFTFWAAHAPRTVFRGVRQLRPGSWALWRDGVLTHGMWWTPDFPEEPREPAGTLAELDALLRSAVDTRMRADVPVGAYLSGGLDSSITCALAAPQTPHALRTFSVTFADPALDESAHQLAVAHAIASDHAIQRIARDEIVRVFPDVVRHAETPLLRTAPAPMYLLAKLARERGTTVVLTGEGADEVFLGYDLFKEAEVRRFCLRRPESAVRPRLFDRLYPYLRAEAGGGAMWRRFFLEAGPPDDPLFSHQPRFRLATFVREFYGDLMRGEVRADVLDELRASLPLAFASWSTLGQASYLEIATLLEGYLLSSQGDRMAMAHGVEGRYPFLDHRLFAFAAALPARSKLRGLQEKAILRRWAAGIVPDAVRARSKQPYRAPDAPAFFGGGKGHEAYVDELLDAPAIRAAGLFDPGAVAGLVRRCRAGRVTAVRENQALVGVLSAQLWYQAFCGVSAQPTPLPLEGAHVLRGDMVPAGLSAAGTA
jgi:asparagine synthase (glutamine-hydrolysing)